MQDVPRQSPDLADLLYDPARSPRSVAEAYFLWGRAQRTAPGSLPPPHDRIRVGYLSANFCANPESLFTLPIIQHHDRRQFDVFCYTNALVSDHYTLRFQRQADHWRDISRLSDADAAALIRRDEIEILVDLSGHWMRGRLPVFALRPAPIQISFPTYPATSGLLAMDYRIADHWTDPPGLTEHLHSEKLIRLNRCYCCYNIPRPLPRVRRLPALDRGYVTFGSFHRMQKLSSELLRLWAVVLHRVPRSRLLFHHEFAEGRGVAPVFRERVVETFARLGVAASRLRFVGLRHHRAHLDLIGSVDIALDAYPYHGMTITCDCFTMGVPVVTLAGRSHVSRVGVSLLTAMELPDWIAESPERYIEIAVRGAGDVGALARLRRSLRRRMRQSPLTDAPGYLKALEEEYGRCRREALGAFGSGSGSGSSAKA